MQRTLGKYELVTPLSVGGMAELYLAFAPGPGGFRKVVALKHVLPDLKTDKRFVERFLDEARLTAGLSHPHIGQVFDLGQEDGEFFLAMEFISGVALHQLLARARALGEQLPLGFVCRVVRDAALGLHHAHSYRDPTGASMAVIHRDVKPNNIMVSFDGVVKVIDFGIAKARGRLARTQKGVVMGTLQYMPIEQLKDGIVDARSDIFSLGVVLWELLAGHYLYVSTSPEQRLSEGTPDITTIVDVPEALAGVVKKALEVDPEQRFATAREMARALEAAYPELADEEQVGALVARMFPDTRSAIDGLLSLSQQGRVDEAAIRAQVKQLRKADRGLTALSTAPRPGKSRASAWPDPNPAVRLDRKVVVPAMLVLAGLALAGGALWALREPERPEIERVKWSRVSRLAYADARKAIVQGRPLEARRLVEECEDTHHACSGLEQLAAEIDQILDASACGTDEAARARVSLAREAAAQGASPRAVELLRTCTAGVEPHPIAHRALEQMNEWNAPPASTAIEVEGQRGALEKAQALEATVAALGRCLDGKTVVDDACYRRAIVTFLMVSLPSARGVASTRAEEALTAYRKLLDRSPPSRELRPLAAEAKVMIDEYDGDLSSRFPGLLVKIDGLRAQPAMAVELLEALLTVKPSSWQAWELLARSSKQLYEQRHQEADLRRLRGAYQKFLELAPADHHGRGRARGILTTLPRPKPNP
jgi:hypothetical protein